MIVHRTATRRADPSLELSRCLTMPADDAAAMTNRLVWLGSIEAALSDVWAPQLDGRDPCTLALANATRMAARALLEHVAARREAARHAERQVRRAISQCLRLPLPPVVVLQVPEAFAYHAVHPLAYAAAAADCLTRWRPSRVVVVGLRPIGATLGAVVAAYCDQQAVPAWACTLRPRDGAADRPWRIDDALAMELRAQAGSLSLIVDEDTSGGTSALASAASLLEAHGHRRDAIVLVCAPDGQPNGMSALTNSERGEDYARVTARGAGPSFAEDWSAGAWRSRIGLDEPRWPPIHPRHERRKGVPVDAPDQLHKFVGLGPWGEAVARRATHAADAGFGVPVFGVSDGYLRMARVTPASTLGRRGTSALASYVLKYLPWRASAMQTGERADVDTLLAVLVANTRERLGDEHDAPLLALEQLARRSPVQPAVVLDGRLVPWEWLQTPAGIVKVDVAEHGDDHCQPGPQDIAWDVAGVLGEFAWTAAERVSLIERFGARLRDASLASRLRWMCPCYLAARLGYAAMAAASLGNTADGRGFDRQARRYARQLAVALAPHA